MAVEYPDDAARVHHGSENIGNCGKDVRRKCQSPQCPSNDPATLQNRGKTNRLCLVGRVRIARKGGLLPAAAECALLCWDGISKIVAHLEP
jgi:hypothetical protein